MSAVPALETLLDPQGPHAPAVRALLTREPGAPRPARLEHLRYKPDTSVVARVVGEPGDQPWWFAAHAPALADKAEKIARRAAESGYPLAAAALPGHPGLRLQAGPVGLDKALFKPLARAGIVDDRGAARGTVLSYNPWRRLVLRRTGTFPGWPGDSTVVRIWAAAPASACLIAPLNAAGVRVLPAEQFTDSGVVQPWAPGGDLETALAAAATAAGGSAAGSARSTGSLLAEVAAALAGLHAVDLTRPEVRRAGLPDVDVAGALAAARDGVAAGLPELVGEFDIAAAAVRTAVTERAAPGAEVLVHGDFSADQIVLDAAGAPWIIDLDRMGTAPAGYDLGGFAAVELIRGRGDGNAAALRAAYRRQPGAAPVTGAQVGAWTAFHLLLRVAEPFRDLDPDCVDRGRARIAAARGCLADA